MSLAALGAFAVRINMTQRQHEHARIAGTAWAGSTAGRNTVWVYQFDTVTATSGVYGRPEYVRRTASAVRIIS
jgi:hypothetical protein